MGNCQACAPYRDRTALVRLHAYDFSKAPPESSSGSGAPAAAAAAYQVCVEVYGREWGYRPAESGGGIFSRAPGEYEQYAHGPAERMGRTELSLYEVENLLRELDSAWPGSAYSAQSKNSGHFCAELCKRLGVSPVPSWALGFAGKGVTVNEHLQKVAAGMQEVASSAAKRACAIDLPPQIRSSAQSIKATAEEVDARLGLTAAAATAAAGAHGLARHAGELDARLGLTAAAAGAAAKAHDLAGQAALNARGAIRNGKEARGAGDSEGYQFGDLTRGLLHGALGGAGAAGPQGDAASPTNAPKAIA